MDNIGWTVHEVSHAIAYIAANPEKVSRVDIVNCGDYAQVVPVLNCEHSELGISHLVNYCCGSLGERVWAGEKDCIINLIDNHGNWIEALFDTPHGGDWDKFAFQAIAGSLDPFPNKEFARALVLAEKILERYLPLADIDTLHRRLLDGGFSLTARDLTPVVH